MVDEIYTSGYFGTTKAYLKFLRYVLILSTYYIFGKDYTSAS
jgi:hypothetical protein